MRQPGSSLPKQEVGRRAERSTLTDWSRTRAGGVLNPLARQLGRLGIHPNSITLVGFILQAGVGVLFFLGRVQLAGALLVIVAPLDALDGAVARALGKDGAFGAFLDSTLDRLSDAVLILGLASHELHRGGLLEVGLLLTALVAALMVSYTRARAEALGVHCQVGLLTRLERILLIAVLSMLGLTRILVWALALLSVFTLLQRMVHVYRVCSRQ